jgi:acetyl esterase/lipase
MRALHCFVLLCSWLVPLPAQTPNGGQDAPDAPAPAAAPALPAAREILDIRYVTGEGAHATKHLLDLYLPTIDPRVGEPPLVMFVHGGAWRAGDRRLYKKLGHVFTERGIACAAISYRLSPEVTHPAHVEDCARAFRWVADHAAEHGYDRQRLFLCGHSAGAHLVALLATDPRHLAAVELSQSDIRGVIPISGPFDVRPEIGLFEQVFGKDAAVRRDASPLAHIDKGQPPFLVLWADRDMAGLPQSGREFAAALGRAGMDVESAEIANRTHATIMTRFGEAGDRTSEFTMAFVTKHGAPAPATPSGGAAEDRKER